MALDGAMLPTDAVGATLAGRLLLDDGPTPVLIRDGAVFDVSREAATIADLMDLPNPICVAGERLFSVDELPADRILAPVDLQAVKAAGVTFDISEIARVIEEKARGELPVSAASREGMEH